MQIVILALPQCLPTSLVGLRDLFRLTRMAAQRARLQLPEFEVRVLSSNGEAVVDGYGSQHAVDGQIQAQQNADMILIPGLTEHDISQVLPEVERLSVTHWLRQQYARGAVVGGSCVGVFMLAEAGLLNGRRCTTTWWSHTELQQQYPKAQCQWGAGLQCHERVITVGGPMSWVDLGLFAIRQLAGEAVARATADFAVIDNTPVAQSVYAPHGYIGEQSPLLLKVESFVRSYLGRPSVDDIASAMTLSNRTLARRIKELTGETPTALINRVKLDMARVMLERDAIPAKQAADYAGYVDESAFRRAFKNQFGKTPREYVIWYQERS